MTAPPIAHDTIRLERTFSHRPARVFGAYADIEQRTRWSAPSDDEFVTFDGHEFRVGGVDEFTCGLLADPTANGTTFAGTTRYASIVENDHIVFTERLVDIGGDLVAMSLVTWLFEPADSGGCRLVIIDQVTSFAGDGPIDGSRHGYTAILDQLERFLTDTSPPANGIETTS